MHRLIKLLLSSVAVVISAGCSLMAPQYSPSIDNVQSLKNGGAYTAKVGAFTSDKSEKNENPISIRGSSMASPYDQSYAAYLAEAIKQELSLSGKFSPNSDVEVSGALLKNNLNAAGFSVGYAEIEARFVVMRGGKPRYDQVKSVRHEWESSFMGGIAIPRAQKEYPNLVQKLLASLYADKAFIEALK